MCTPRLAVSFSVVQVGVSLHSLRPGRFPAASERVSQCLSMCHSHCYKVAKAISIYQSDYPKSIDEVYKLFHVLVLTTN